jgi:hypothetical protein
LNNLRQSNAFDKLNKTNDFYITRFEHNYWLNSTQQKYLQKQGWTL